MTIPVTDFSIPTDTSGNAVGALLNERAFHLHCAYPRDGLINGEGREVDAVCGLHSHVLIACEMAA